MADALSYEYLIRKGRNCGRYGVAGADADIFRRLERDATMYNDNLTAARNNQPRTRQTPIEEMAFDVGVSTGKIVAYIRDALQNVKNKMIDDLTDEQHEEFEELSVTLLTPTMSNIEDVIERGHTLFEELGVQMG